MIPRYLAKLMPVIIITISVLACGSSPPTNPPLQTRAPNPVETIQPPSTELPPELPSIDVVITNVVVAGSCVTDGDFASDTFELNVEVENRGSTWPTSGAVNLVIRANIKDGFGATDLAIGSFTIWDLLAGKQQKTIEAMSPTRAGVWVLYVTIEPAGFIDTSNNRIRHPP